jgi:hypothetical protein
MTYFYEVGAIRWKHHTQGDPRGFRPAKGWSAEAMVIDDHPITAKPFKLGAQWWIKETFEGEDA